eukprot:Clim_evm19s6 gene=Clim_evmTU19s6
MGGLSQYGRLKLALQRFGNNQNMHWRIAVKRFGSRDGRFIEHVGSFNSKPYVDGAKHYKLDFNRIRYWIGQGAEPTEPVAKILGQAGILPPFWRNVAIHRMKQQVADSIPEGPEKEQMLKPGSYQKPKEPEAEAEA